MTKLPITLPPFFDSALLHSRILTRVLAGFLQPFSLAADCAPIGNTRGLFFLKTFEGKEKGPVVDIHPGLLVGGSDLATCIVPHAGQSSHEFRSDVKVATGIRGLRALALFELALPERAASRG